MFENEQTTVCQQTYGNTIQYIRFAKFIVVAKSLFFIAFIYLRVVHVQINVTLTSQ